MVPPFSATRPNASPRLFAQHRGAKRRGERLGLRRWPLCDHVQESMLPCTKRRAPVHAGWTPLFPATWGECLGWTPRQNPQRQRRHTVARYARPPPLRRRFSPIFSFVRSVQAKKWENAFKEGGRATLPAFGRRLSCDGVRGKPPK